MNRHQILVVGLGIISAIVMGTSSTEAQNDFYSLYNRYRFHETGYSARSAAMGGVYSALQDADNGLLGNPAALGFQKSPYISGGFDWRNVGSDITLLNPNDSKEAEAEMWNTKFGGLYPFEWGAVSLLYSYRTDELTSEAASSIVGFMEQNGDLDRHHVGLGAGYNIIDNLAVGYRFGYFDYDFDRTIDVVRPAPFQFDSSSEEFQGHRHQFGVQYMPIEQVVLGLDGYVAFGDRDANYPSSDDAEAWMIRGGVAWRIDENIPLLVAMDLNFENRQFGSGGDETNEDLFGLHIGAEYEVYENLFLRAGYEYEASDYNIWNDWPVDSISEVLDISGYTAGIGYKYNQINFDYAFQYIDTASGDIGNFFTIGYEF